jgi:hypothetical protein
MVEPGRFLQRVLVELALPRLAALVPVQTTPYHLAALAARAEPQDQLAATQAA